MNLLKKLNELYATGIGYEEFLDGADEVTKSKHLHYLEKMKLSDDEVKELPKIRNDYKILVFCETDCKDCRIVLATMAQVKQVMTDFEFKIVPRSINLEIMKHIHKDHRIPMVVAFNSKEYKLIFNEIPNSFASHQIIYDEQSAIDLRIDFRKGKYKQEIIEQIVKKL